MTPAASPQPSILKDSRVVAALPLLLVGIVLMMV
ncbi:MAG: hypothetical protein RLZZ450_2765, partial [Pseudomonadota bacterium]